MFTGQASFEYCARSIRRTTLLSRLVLSAALATFWASGRFGLLVAPGEPVRHYEDAVHLKLEPFQQLTGQQRWLNLLLGTWCLKYPVMIDPIWIGTGNLTTARYGHTATLLPNGKVLVAGGSNGNSLLISAELYDPALGTWSVTGSLLTERERHTATLLSNGKVLVVGGYNNRALSSAELYDPALGTWSTTGSLVKARYGHTATLLPNGKVLVVGGYDSGPVISAEIYDPVLGIWSATGNLNSGHSAHTATLLPNGKVLVMGLPSGGAELYDPALGMWSVTSSPTTPRESHTATLLPNGKILVTGGHNGGDLSSAEIYDPVLGRWNATSNLNTGRSTHTATLLPNGKVLVAGGYKGDFLSSAEIYDPTLGTWSATGNLNSGRFGHTETLLLNGKVLVAGGRGNRGYLSSAELYDPTPQSFPSPSILRLSPDWVTNRRGPFTLSVTGANFVNGSVVRWNNSDRPTTYVSSTQLIALISASDTSVTGNASVTVFNPAPGGGTSNIVFIPITNVLANVSAASYRPRTFAPESIVAAFGTDLATMAQVASTIPLPTSLAGTTVVIKDNSGSERPAPLFFVSPTQVNYQIPPSTNPGTATVTITGGNGSIAKEEIEIQSVSPGIFSANASGQGVAAGQVLRFRIDNTQSYEPIARYDSAQGKFVPVPIDLGTPTDQVFLILYGTGIRYFSSLAVVNAQVGGAPVQVLYAGPQGGFVGLDQINLRLPRTLIGRGEVDALIIFNEFINTNIVKVTVK